MRGIGWGKVWAVVLMGGMGMVWGQVLNINQSFSSSNPSYHIPSPAQIQVYVFGAGGGGQGGHSWNCHATPALFTMRCHGTGGGGGGGGAALGSFNTDGPATLNITVGSGGSQGTPVWKNANGAPGGGNGGQGGSSSVTIGSTVIATAGGGHGGHGGSWSGGAGGSGSISGNPGGSGSSDRNSGGWGGSGGSISGFGSGGGGGAGGYSESQSGGRGNNGLVILRVTYLHTVTFNSNSESTINPQKVLNGLKATQPTTPTRSGYTFAGWWTEQSGGSQWNFADSITENRTLYARWMPNISFQALAFEQWTRNGGSVTLNWDFSNPNNLGGNFWIYRRTGTGSWSCLNSIGIALSEKSYIDNTTTFNISNYQYAVVYQQSDTPNSATLPANSTSVTSNIIRNATSSSVNTTPQFFTPTASSGTQQASIDISFVAGINYTGSYNIEFRTREPESRELGTWKNWGEWNDMLNGSGNFDRGDAQYTRTHTGLITCNEYEYRVNFLFHGSNTIRQSGSTKPLDVLRFTAPLRASKGEYANQVRLEWTVEGTNNNPQIYRISRRTTALGSDFPAGPWVVLETVTSSTLTNYWSDNNALIGVFYDYLVELPFACTSPSEDIGFVQAFGTVSGRVTYGTGNAVPGVNMLVRRNDLQAGENQYLSLKSEGDGRIFEWRDSVKFNDIWVSKRWTLQFWINPDGRNTETSIHIGNVGDQQIRMDAVAGGYQIYMEMDLAASARSEIIPARQFSHITITRTGDDMRIYTVVGQSLCVIPYSQFTYTLANALTAVNSRISFGHFLKGNIDDVRFWDRALPDSVIFRDYSRYLVGNETGLIGYWTFDDALLGKSFDRSRVGTVYNGNHATRNDLDFCPIVPNDSLQLALKGITDANGNYQINGIPYQGEGSSYSIVPSLGVHQFNPTEQLRYISPTSMVHNGTDFTNISSFRVSGTVVYEGGTYPVEGCSFEINDRPVTLPNGQLVTTDHNGNFEISVPIGVHSVRVVKSGHTFVDDGYFLENGQNINYNADMLNRFTIENTTRVKLIGRVVGGLTEHEKVLGFGESKNNIGVQTITLESVRPQFNFQNNPFNETFFHNEDSRWKKPDGRQNDSTTVGYHDDKIVVTVSSETGEFVALVYPEPYIVSEIRVPGANNTSFVVYDNRETIDLTTVAVSDSSMLRTSIRTWQDSTFIRNRLGVIDHWEYFESSDTVRYNAEWTYYYQSTPTFSIRQVVNNVVLDYFGEEFHIFRDELTGQVHELELYDKNNGTYLFDNKPLFRQGENYTFRMQAYEEYTNYISDPEITVQYPVKSGIVNMANNIRLSSQPENIEMDENGEARYSFIAGAPNLTTGSNNFYATLSLGNISYYWDMGTEPLEAWHLGNRTTGTDFMTAGPDKVDIILRDPPGSNSKAYIEEGTTITNKTSHSFADGSIMELNGTLGLGSKIITWAGIGAGVITETEYTLDISGGVKTEVKTSDATEVITSTTFTERIETSDSEDYVGSAGDIFVGHSTNILYGLTNSITIQKENNEDDVFATGGGFSIVPATSLAFGETFATRFVFTQRQIEEIMIPSWREALANLLEPVGTVPNTAVIEEPVYVSKLSRGHVHFGKLNTDKIAFGSSASSNAMYHDGPSYKIYIPDDYTADGFDDLVMYYNNQINGWISELEANEREKVNTVYTDNYSFGGGVSIEFSKASVKATETIKTFNFAINPTAGLKTGFEIFGARVEVELKQEWINEWENSSGTTNDTTIITGFVLQTSGTADQLTVDYGMSESGTFVFRTRGGRTSCPHEPLELTKYFEPGRHILNENTMQIEVPKIRVASAPHVINVPANRTATFVLAMENESETGEDVWFQLIVDEATNPHGAEMKIDGGIIGNGRMFLVPAGETLNKTLTVGKGTADTYENIALILRSPCQEEINDVTHISVEFIPAVTEVAISEPRQNWILNADSPTGDILNITIDNFDVNFPNFGYIRLEFRPIASPNWNTIMMFYPSHLYENAQGLKEDIGTRAVITYPWKMPDADGEYEIRAMATSVNAVDGVIIGNPLSTFITEAVSGFKDMQRPISLGAPSPTNGILGVGDELSITFNEDIQTGMLTQNNFSITGVLNAQEIAEPNVGLNFTGTQSAQTELPIFVNGSFSIETWFMRNPNTAGTLFTFGTNNNSISLGFNATGNAILRIGSETYTSTAAIANDNTWKYIAMSYDRDANTVSVYQFEGATTNTLFNNRALTAVPETQGRLVIGNNITGGNDGFRGAVALTHFYGAKRTLADVSASKSVTKSGREHGLIGYWPLDEGTGTVAVDKARSRNLVMNNTGWYIYPSGYAKHTNNNYFSIPTATYPLDVFSDFTLEFWFRSESNGQRDQTVFSADNGYISINSTGGLTLYKNDGTVIRSLTLANLINAQWHHVAMSVRRGGNVNVFVNGVTTATFPETLLGTFASGHYYFGAKRTPSNTFGDYFAGYFDEIRIWNSALTRDGVLLNKNNKLRGDEPGLQAYYPFENYVRQSNGLITVTSTNNNMVDPAMAASGAAVLSSTAMSVKDVRPIEDVPFTFVASNNKIVFTLAPNVFSRVEGTILNVSVRDVRDMRNNKSNTESWTAFVRRNSLVWETDPVSIMMEEGDTRTFSARITNTGGTAVSFAIENLPSWLTVSSSTGSLQPTASRDLTFTVSHGVNIGNYETAIGLTSGNGVTEILPVQLKVTGQRPDWEVDPNEFTSSMNVMGQIKIDGVFQDDPDDILAAFIGDRCVGIASPSYIESMNAWFVFVTIYGNNVHNNEPVTFKLWDASTGRTYPVVETSVTNIRFVPQTLVGSAAAPVIFDALDISEQAIYLRRGWNWISANVVNSDPAIFDQMKTSLSSAGVIIKGQTEFVQQNAHGLGAGSWIGTQTDVSEKSMYIVNTNRDHLMILKGQPVNPASSSIDIANGWNWIGYTPSFTLPVNSALAGFDARVGDIVKGQTGFATYVGGSNGWIGSLPFMHAGRGYMYHSTNTAPQSFVYPSQGSQPGMMAMSAPPMVSPVWSVDHTAFTSTMTMAAVVVNNGTEVRSDMIEIGAFAGDENRGSAVLKYEPSLDRYVGFLMIYGDGNEEIHLKVYDHEEEMEYAADNTAITFVAEGFFGVPNLYVVSIGTVFGEWSDWVVTKEPTCTEAGSRERTRTCAVSGDIDKQTEAIDALGHDWDEWTITKEPTCTEAGVQTAICKHDAEHAKTEEIDALGHDWGEWVVTPPTSTSDGDSTRVCLRDGSHIETVVISMLTWRQSIVDMINDIVTAPVDRLTNRLVAGPNPAAKSSGKIAFFREGELIKDATLIIYDANGNIVNRIKISDNASDLGKSRSGSAARRAVGEWNLKDAKNRPVGTGTYVVKGVLIGIDGRRETISLIVGVQ